MIQIGALGFATPWLLLGLLVLPILWWLLRATPPAPVRERFPGVAILLGLEPPEKTPDRTPWWLLLLRMVIAGLAILAFAQPLLNPRESLRGDGPLRLVMDGGWASAPDWDARIAAANDVLGRAERAGITVQLEILAREQEVAREAEILTAADARARIEALEPAAWPPNRFDLFARLEADAGDATQTVWLHDGLDGEEQFGPLAAKLAEVGELRMVGPEVTVRAVLPKPPEGGGLGAQVLRASAGAEATAQVIGYSAEDDGTRRALAVAPAAFEAGAMSADAVFDAPLELRNRIAVLGIEGQNHAGAVSLLDDRWRRKRVGLVSGERPEGGQRLLSGTHYVRNALETSTELREGAIDDLLEANADVIVLIDVGAFPDQEAADLLAWVEEGGVLIRFAGPTLAATADEQRNSFGAVDDPLLPVRLRPGGRDLGGAMSWGEPQKIASFSPDSPFAGLEAPEDARINKQVLAEPDIDLPTRTWASLTDGAPLVTSDKRGDGRIVLFHTGADPRWSTLPLSGLFIELLDRVVTFGVGGDAQAGVEVTGFWSPLSLIGADGVLRDAPEAAKTIEGALLGKAASETAPPGLYQAVGGAEAGALRAHNLLPADATLAAAPPPPENAIIETLGARKETELKSWFLALALGLLMIDALAALALAGKLRGAVAAALVACLAFGAADPALADEAEKRAVRAALDGSLGYVITGDEKSDKIAAAGLYGLTRALIERTSVEPGDPKGVNLETDELAVYPLIYWGISDKQPRPSDEAIARLNEYMRRGGMLLLDTRDRNLALGSGDTPGLRAMRRLTSGLDLPPLSPVPEGHVLRRSFFLLDEFPGRWDGGKVWVEAAPPEDIEKVAEEGAFKNDGVSPVMVGSHDWAGAWAMDDRGRRMLPMSGRNGERRRELALRFGVNLVMYAYTGSYKSDQVHIPALLQRLGQ